MRIVLTLVAACVALAGCTSSDNVNSTPASVFFYNVAGNNVSQAEARDQSYCARFGRSALFRGLQPGQSGNIAVFRCADVTPAGGEPAPLAGQ